MKILIILLCLVGLYLCNQKTTYETEFENTFKVKHLSEGDKTNYPQAGNTVSVHYTGTFLDGNQFDSSKSRNQPFSFTLKRGQVIQCWDEVVSRMSKGEKIYVVCPSKLAYGERGAGGVIPPNTDIAFEIEMLDYEGKKVDL